MSLPDDSDKVAALAVEALHELGFSNTEGQEMTSGMEAVLELMHLASEAQLTKEKLKLVEQATAERTPKGRKYRLYGIVSRVLGKDYRCVSPNGRGLPRGFWSRLEDELNKAGIEMTRQNIKKWFDASPLRWVEALQIAAILEEHSK